MNVNYLAVLLATVLQFMAGAAWYTFLGPVWGKIHGFDKLPKATQEKMMKSMGPLYAGQFAVTLVTSFVLAIFISNQPTWNPYAMAGFFWLGFVVPTQVSAVIFGGTKGEWVAKKIMIMAGGSLLCLEIAATILHFMR